MTRNRKSKFGEFEFVIKTKEEWTIIGRVEWIFIKKLDQKIFVKSNIFVHDERLETSSINGDGLWKVFPIGPAYVEVVCRNIEELNYNGDIQCEILCKSIDYVRNINSTFNSICDSYNDYKPVLLETRYAEYQKIPLLHILDKFFRYLITGKEEFDINATRRAENIGPNPSIRKKSEKLFQLTTAISGIITVILCVRYMNIDIPKIAIAISASVTAWAARETALIGDRSDDYDYTFSVHWRGSLWKLIGYVSTAMVSVAVLSGIHSGLSK